MICVIGDSTNGFAMQTTQWLETTNMCMLGFLNSYRGRNHMHVLVPQFSPKLLFTQKLHGLNDSCPGGRKVDSLCPDLQHLNKAFVGIVSAFLRNAS